MDGIDVERLRQLTLEARLRAAEERKRLRKEQEDKEAQRKRADELKARQVILQIPGRAETEARQGRNHAIVVSIGYDDFDRPHDYHNWNKCESEWLKGSANTVFQACLGAGLKPTLEFWHDGVGENSGFNIVIHWL